MDLLSEANYPPSSSGRIKLRVIAIAAAGHPVPGNTSKHTDSRSSHHNKHHNHAATKLLDWDGRDKPIIAAVFTAKPHLNGAGNINSSA